MKAIIVKEVLFDVLNSLMRHEGVLFPFPLKVVFEGDFVYLKYVNSARLSDASATLFELGIPHRCVID